MRSPKVNKSKLGKVTLTIPMEDIEEIDAVASYYSMPIEHFILVCVGAAVVNAKEDMKSHKNLFGKKVVKKPVAKKAPAKKAATKKKAPAKKKSPAKKK